MEEKLTMSVHEAARELGICLRYVYQLCHREDFPAIRFGRNIRISREGLREWVRDNECNTLEVRR